MYNINQERDLARYIKVTKNDNGEKLLATERSIIFYIQRMSFMGTIIIKEEEDWFVATCLENDIASQGKTINEAISNLKEAIALYYEDEEDISITKSKQVYVTTLEMAI